MLQNKPDMILIPGGSFRMGSEKFYPEERPSRAVELEPFLLDATPVTNRRFAAFVAATAYVTLAERQPVADDYPDADPALLVPGSAVFLPPQQRVGTDNHRLWWRYVKGASWQHPYGPDSNIAGLEEHPVVHIAYQDAEAYAQWVGKRLPGEAEWERAARGGLVDAEYAWGYEPAPDQRRLANYWVGEFPNVRLADDGFSRTSPVGFYPPNGYGLYDMIGNVWEWTSDWYVQPHKAREAKSCCAPDLSAASKPESTPAGQNQVQSGLDRKVLKGGSHLCADNYCHRYRPAARHAQMLDSSTSHIGFRCALSI